MIIIVMELWNSFSDKVTKHSCSVCFGCHYSNNPNHISMLWKDPLWSPALKHTFTKPFFFTPMKSFE